MAEQAPPLEAQRRRASSQFPVISDDVLGTAFTSESSLTIDGIMMDNATIASVLHEAKLRPGVSELTLRNVDLDHELIAEASIQLFDPPREFEMPDRLSNGNNNNIEPSTSPQGDAPGVADAAVSADAMSLGSDAESSTSLDLEEEENESSRHRSDGDIGDIVEQRMQINPPDEQMELADAVPAAGDPQLAGPIQRAHVDENGRLPPNNLDQGDASSENNDNNGELPVARQHAFGQAPPQPPTLSNARTRRRRLGSANATFSPPPRQNWNGKCRVWTKIETLHCTGSIGPMIAAASDAASKMGGNDSIGDMDQTDAEPVPFPTSRLQIQQLWFTGSVPIAHNPRYSLDTASCHSLQSALLSSNLQLTTLCLKGTRLDPPGLEALCIGLQTSACLKSLRLSHCAIEAHHVRSMLAPALAQNRQLQELVLAHCKLLHVATVRTRTISASAAASTDASSTTEEMMAVTSGTRRDEGVEDGAHDVEPPRRSRSAGGDEDVQDMDIQNNPVESTSSTNGSQQVSQAQHGDFEEEEEEEPMDYVVPIRDSPNHQPIRPPPRRYRRRRRRHQDIVEHDDNEDPYQEEELDDCLSDLLEQLKHHPTLEILTIHGMTCSSRAVQAMSSILLQPATRLVELGLKNNVAPEDRLDITSLWQALASNTTLQRLHVVGNNLTNDAVYALTQILFPTTTVPVIFNGGGKQQAIHNGGMQNRQRLNSTLSSLNLTANQISDEGLQALAAGLAKVHYPMPLPRYDSQSNGQRRPDARGLRQLNVQRNPFTMQGQQALIESLTTNVELERLDMDGTYHGEKAYYLNLNRGGRRLLLEQSAASPGVIGGASTGQVPLGLWSHVLGRVNRLNFGRHPQQRTAQLDVLWHLLRNGPALLQQRRPSSLWRADDSSAGDPDSGARAETEQEATSETRNEAIPNATADTSTNEARHRHPGRESPLVSEGVGKEDDEGNRAQLGRKRKRTESPSKRG